MLHAPALPGTPRYRASELIEPVLREAVLYQQAGFDGLILENMHDRPYLKAVGPEVVAWMTRLASAVVATVDLPVGVQILAGANQEALAVAQASGAHFIRAEGFVFGHLADEGLFEAQAGQLLRYRRLIGAESVAVLADIKKKHSSHAITADVSLVETARAAAFFLADGVIVTGESTGSPTDPDQVAEVSSAVKIPVYVGSGVTPTNVGQFPQAAGLIVGSWVKQDGHWANPVCPHRLAQLARTHMP